MAKHITLGKTGEMIAQKYLKRQGHLLVETNYRYGRAEVDIISKIDGVLVFSEVKTRSTEVYGYPEEAISVHKQKQLSKVAEYYLEKHGLDMEIRFDIISIIKNKRVEKLLHIPDAFFLIF